MRLSNCTASLSWLRAGTRCKPFRNIHEQGTCASHRGGAMGRWRGGLGSTCGSVGGASGCDGAPMVCSREGWGARPAPGLAGSGLPGAATPRPPLRRNRRQPWAKVRTWRSRRNTASEAPCSITPTGTGMHSRGGCCMAGLLLTARDRPLRPAMAFDTPRWLWRLVFGGVRAALRRGVDRVAARLLCFRGAGRFGVTSLPEPECRDDRCYVQARRSRSRFDMRKQDHHPSTGRSLP